jgi:hypothetical protein
MHPSLPSAAPHRAESLAAGGLYLAIIVLGVWSEAAVRSALVVPGDAGTTAANVLAAEGLFRASLAADAVMAMCDVGLAVLLYRLLRPAGVGLALAATAFRLIQTAVIAANLLTQHTALRVLEGVGGFEDAAGLALLLLDAHSHGYDLGLLFFGVNSLLVGALLWRSTFPRILGPALGAAGVVYLVGSSLRFLAPGVAEAFAPAYLVPLLAESALCFVLLWQGRPWAGQPVAGAPGLGA